MEIKTPEMLYEENKDLLKIILIIGNKVVLQRQLRDVAIKLGLATNKDSFNKLITELKQADILNAHDYKGDSNGSKFIEIRNPYIKYLVNEELELRRMRLDQTTVGKKLSDYRKYVSMFRLAWVLKLLDSKTAKQHKIDSTESLLKYLYKETTLLHSKHRGVEMYQTFVLQNEDVIQLQESEKSDILYPLAISKAQMITSRPSRKGKKKGHSEEVIQDIQNSKSKNKEDTVLSEVDEEAEKEKRKKFRECVESIIMNIEGVNEVSIDIDMDTKSESKNDFNSFLGRDSFLRLVHFKKVEKKVLTGIKDEFEIRMVDDLKFKMIIFDIYGSIEYDQVSEKISKTYLMLKNTFGQEQYFDIHKKCSICKNNKESKCYVPEFDGANIKAELYCIKPVGQIEGNRIYRNCEFKPAYKFRNITLEVEVACMNSEDMKDLERKCLAHSRTPDTRKLREYNNITHELMNSDILKSDLSNISIKYSSFNFDIKFDNVHTHENIKKHNKKKAEDKKKIEKMNERMLKLYDMGLAGKIDELLNDL